MVKSPRKTEKNSLKGSWTKTVETKMDIDVLADYGFAEDRCHRCGIHNSEISGLLMQCGKCKKAYYCSMKCFNDDLPWHQKFCQTSRLGYNPSRDDITKFEFKRPPRLAVEAIGDNLYKVKATHHSSIIATDANGHTYKPNLDDGMIFSYTKGKSHEKRGTVQGHKHVRKLYGTGPLTLTADNGDGKIVTVTVDPAEPGPPKIKVDEIRPGLYKIVASDQAGFPVTIKGKDSEGNTFHNLEPGTFFTYDRFFKGSQQDQSKQVQQLAGQGELLLTAINADGKETTIAVKPSEPNPPKLKIQHLGENLYKLKVKDPTALQRPLEITARDGDGYPITLAEDDIFSYIDAGSGKSQLQQENDSQHGAVQKIRGHGNLKITVTNCFGKETSASVSPGSAPPPTVQVEALRDGYYRVHANDPNKEPLTIQVVDHNGDVFLPGLENKSIFSYTEAGAGTNQQQSGKHPFYESVQKLRGHGELTITVTNASGKTVQASVEPAVAPPPVVKLHELEHGVYQLSVSDESGNPVTILAVDSNRNTFNDSLADQSIFRYEEAGKRAVTQEIQEDDKHGGTQKIRGKGDLIITAINSAGKESKIVVKPTEPDPPSLQLQDMGDGHYKIVASDKDGEPVTIQAADKNGNLFTAKPDMIFRYEETGKRPAGQVTRDHGRHGSTEKMYGNGELTFTAVNSAGKESKVDIKPTEPDPPSLKVQDIGDGYYKILASDRDESNVTVKAEDSHGHLFKAEPDMILRYFRTDGAAEQTSYKHPTHGNVSNIYGKGDLTFTATNDSGKESTAQIKASESGEPQIDLQELEPGVFFINAMDPNGDPVTIQAEDADGNSILAIPVKSTLRYSDDGPEHSKTDGNMFDFQMPELWITCYNKAGKTKKMKVKAPPRKPREHVLPLTIDELQIDSPNSPSKTKQKKRVLTREVRDKLIFWYGRLGHPERDVMMKKVARLPKSCGITPEDVELLPWIMGGRMLKTKELHDKVMENTTVYIEKEIEIDSD